MSKSKTSNNDGAGEPAGCACSKGAKTRGAVIVVSAPSGCGKTTIVDRLLNRHPEWQRSISVTTRAPRFNEKNGVNYFFVDDQEFNRLRESGELLEYARVIDRFYGTPRKFVCDSLRDGKAVILEIDVQGAKKIKKALDAKVPLLSIFVLPPSIKVLRERLEGRKTETPEQIQLRIEVAQEEIKEAGSYDVTVVNQNLDLTVVEIESAILNFIKERRTD